MALGLMGRKLGVSEVNDGARGRIAVTVVEAGPCLVVDKRTAERDGYCAFALGFGDRKEKRTAKAQRAVYAKLNASPRRHLREFRVDVEDLAKFQPGEEIKASDVFSEGDLVDVTGRTKGRGFTGVVKRWGFSGQDASHGAHEFFRHGGSIGANTWPAHTFKNMKMPGHYGDEKVTTSNLRVVKVVPEENCLLLEGSVPGATNGLLILKPAAKRKKQPSVR